jgi:hypothetical protein
MSIVHYGERFRLRWASRKRGQDSLYLISAEKAGREYYPRMGTIAEAVLLVFAGTQPEGQPVSSRATVRLSTTETLVGDANTIGAWAGNHFLYYQPPGRPEQEWQIEVDTRSVVDGKIRAGDRLAFHNRQSSERRMAQDLKEPAYLSLDPAARGFWHIELL